VNTINDAKASDESTNWHRIAIHVTSDAVNAAVLHHNVMQNPSHCQQQSITNWKTKKKGASVHEDGERRREGQAIKAQSAISAFIIII